MKIPEGMTEEQIVQIVNKILDFWANTIKIPSFTAEDVRQEGWVYALLGLDRFTAEPTERNVFNFLTRHISYRLLYLKQVKEGTYKMPCKGCPFADGSMCKLGEKKNCEAWAAWNTKFERRSSYEKVVDPIEYEHNHLYEVDLDKEIDQKDIIRKIFNNLPFELRADFLRMLDGVYLITKRRLRLRDKITEILGGEYE